VLEIAVNCVPSAEIAKRPQALNARIPMTMLREVSCMLGSGTAFMNCMTQLCATFSNVMWNHWAISKWRLNLDKTDGSAGGTSQDLSALMQPRRRAIWDDICRKIAVMLQSPFLLDLDFDGFIRLLDLVAKFNRIGEEFAGGQVGGESLDVAVRSRAAFYFAKMHGAKMTDLGYMFSQDSWRRLPLQAGFHLSHLKEFAFISQPRGHGHQRSRSSVAPGTLAAASFFADCKGFNAGGPAFLKLLKPPEERAQDKDIFGSGDGEEGDEVETAGDEVRGRVNAMTMMMMTMRLFRVSLRRARFFRLTQSTGWRCIERSGKPRTSCI
jgi:hypothetical protein